MWFFIALALIGFAASVAVHVSTFLGADPQEWSPPVWLLHVGIFAVFVPAILLQKRTKKSRGGNVLSAAPPWMRLTLGTLFGYCFLNFAVFSARMDGTPGEGPKAGSFILHNHGRFVRSITAPEYHHYRALVVRGFSGHWMLFYAASAATIYSATSHARPASPLPPVPMLHPRPSNPHGSDFQKLRNR
jgi:hypothetical protein